MSSSTGPSSYVKPPGWNPIVITMVGVFCSIFLVFSYYKILRRNCLSFRGVRFSRSTRFQRRFLNIERFEDPSLQFQNQGLDSFVMHSIPIAQFKKKGEGEPEKENDIDCAVCLGEFEDDEWVKGLPSCSHVFHVACIDTWFQAHSSCLLCKSNVTCIYEVSFQTPMVTPRTENLPEKGSRQNEALWAQISRNSSLRLDIENQR